MSPRGQLNVRLRVGSLAPKAVEHLGVELGGIGLVVGAEQAADAELAVALLALFAHMERVFMRERAAHARAVAAAKGTSAGRPASCPPAQITAARAAVAAGQHVDQVADAFGVSRATLYRHLPGDIS
jgi:DNA invertase Pin-like site-specific DNA recombinase